jgi:hypothetical protein
MTPGRHLSGASLLVLALIASSSLASCATQGSTASAPVVAQNDGAVQLSTPGGGDSAPTLSDLQSYVPDSDAPSPKEQGRLDAIRQAALTYGLQGGLAHGLQQIDGIVRSHADFLTKTYNFGAMMIDAPPGHRRERQHLRPDGGKLSRHCRPSIQNPLSGHVRASSAALPPAPTVIFLIIIGYYVFCALGLRMTQASPIASPRLHPRGL